MKPLQHEIFRKKYLKFRINFAKILQKPVKIEHADLSRISVRFLQCFSITRKIPRTDHSTVTPLLSGHPRDFGNWLLNRGWPFNIGIEYCSLETLKEFGTLKNGRLMEGGRLKGGRLIEVLLYLHFL